MTDDGFTRGDDDTIELLSNVLRMSEELGESCFLHSKLPLTPWSFSRRAQVAFHYLETMANRPL